MKTILGISLAVLATIMLAGSVLAQYSGPITLGATVTCNVDSDCSGISSTYVCYQNQCVAPTCGIGLSDSPDSVIGFGSIVPGAPYVQSPDTTLVTNTGNTHETPTILGTDWHGSQWSVLNWNSMPVGATGWTTSDWTNGVYLTTSAAPIVGSPMSPGGSTTVYYELTVPSTTPTDSYTQTITFGTGC